MSSECEFPKTNATSDEIKSILKNYKTIAVVGLSDNPERPSFHVAEYLKSKGYRIIPVNPSAAVILGEKAYPNLKAIPEPVDIVDVFRKPEALPEITDEAIAIKAKVLWMQEGIVHNISADKARKAGLQVVMNKCILKEHMRI